MSHVFVTNWGAFDDGKLNIIMRLLTLTLCCVSDGGIGASSLVAIDRGAFYYPSSRLGENSEVKDSGPDACPMSYRT